jgi:hypothetical protein
MVPIPKLLTRAYFFALIVASDTLAGPSSKRGGLHDVAHANEELVPEEQAQRGEAVAHRRLLDLEAGSSLGDVAIPHHRVEGDEEVEVERAEVEVVDRRHGCGLPAVVREARPRVHALALLPRSLAAAAW